MNSVTLAGFVDELSKIAKLVYKGPNRMPPRTKANIKELEDTVRSWDSPHKEDAVQFMDKVGPAGLFEILHSMRRWYSGGTMQETLLKYHEPLSSVMDLEPKDALGVHRGFKVPKDNPLAQVKPGEQLELEVKRNRGFSSWSSTEGPTHKFSGGGKGKTGLIVKLVDSEGVTPVLAPPDKTKPWFNELYAHAIGSSFRPKEQEYLLAGPSLKVEVVKVKR